MAERRICNANVIGSSPVSGSMRYSFYDSEKYKKKQSIITKKAWKRGDFNWLHKRVKKICKRNGCDEVLEVKPSDPKVFCSQACAATVNNIGRRRRPIVNCLNCSNETARSTFKYCSNACQINFQYKFYIKQWKDGKKSGLKCTGVVNRYIKKYLREKYNNRCCLCGWSKVNLKSGIVPLVADHIDGNWKNNKEENLRLLCPNCDSLTPTYQGLNRGNGRESRAPSKRSEISKILSQYSLIEKT